MNILNTLTKEEVFDTKLIKIKSGYVLFREEEKCDSIGIIEKGKIEISTYLSNGEKIVYNTLKTGEIFGGNLIFSSDPFFKGNVVAIDDCEIRLISKYTLKKLFSQNEKFLECYLQIQSNFTKKLNSKIKMLSMNSAQDRILFMLECANSSEIKFKSITSLAENLGLSRESVSRTISKMVKENAIIYSKNK